jgi:hypothetical protein
MDWQIVTVSLCLAVAAVYLGRRAWRTWAGTGGRCGGSCGCAASASSAKPDVLIGTEELTARLRGRR